ncbi:MAG: C39 family peptidase [Parcubacteria group bacterium]|jgi:peptidoglycan hydrolase CwlO-like protein
MKIKKNILIILFFLFIVHCSLFTVALADDTVDCDTLTGDAKDECENLEKKAKVYQELIDIKNKQQDTLSSQLQTIDKEQEMNRLQISSTQKQINDLDKRINDLEKSILTKEDDLNAQKKILVGLMQSYYEYDQQGLLDLVLIDKDFSDTVVQADYLDQSSVKLSEVVSTIEKDRNEMLDNRNELNQKREDINKKKEDLTDRTNDLAYNENQKQSLLTKTQGEEQKYQDLLAHVEAQKKELFNFSEASNLGEVSASVSSYSKPKDNLASTSWYFSQRDSRWGNKRIGNSSSLMKDYGCAVTSVAMVFREKGASIDPGKMAGQKIFYYDLIKWPATWSPGIALTSSIGHGNIKWSTIDSEIKSGNPVIVYIGKTNGGGGHYVVITGKDSKDYIVHDPYFGANLYLGTSKSLVGKIGRDSGVRVDQMIIYH